jgi:hypothetical protein
VVPIFQIVAGRLHASQKRGDKELDFDLYEAFAPLALLLCGFDAQSFIIHG